MMADYQGGTPRLNDNAFEEIFIQAGIGDKIIEIILRSWSFPVHIELVFPIDHNNSYIVFLCIKFRSSVAIPILFIV